MLLSTTVQKSIKANLNAYLSVLKFFNLSDARDLSAFASLPRHYFTDVAVAVVGTKRTTVICCSVMMRFVVADSHFRLTSSVEVPADRQLA